MQGTSIHAVEIVLLLLLLFVVVFGALARKLKTPYPIVLAAWLTSWREFSYNLVSICLLAFGIVEFTRLESREHAVYSPLQHVA